VSPAIPTVAADTAASTEIAGSAIDSAVNKGGISDSLVDAEVREELLTALNAAPEKVMFPAGANR
jgi:hypothetical protein